MGKQRQVVLAVPPLNFGPAICMSYLWLMAVTRAVRAGLQRGLHRGLNPCNWAKAELAAGVVGTLASSSREFCIPASRLSVSHQRYWPFPVGQ